MPPLRSAQAAPAPALAVPRGMLLGVLATLLALVTALAPAGVVRAEGSVPSEVRDYVASGALVRQLNELYGVNAAGQGIDFDDTATAGTIERIHVWSADKRAGLATDRPLDLTNEWVVPISIAEEPVGLARIWINPQSVAPELALFVPDPALALAIAEVPDGASLVHDDASAAWLALDDEGILTPLVPGRTGLSTPVPVDDVALLPPEEAPAASGDPNTGLALAVAVVAVLFAIIVVALVVPAARGRRRDPEAGADAEAGDADPAADAGSAPVAALEAAVADRDEPAADRDEPA